MHVLKLVHYLHLFSAALFIGGSLFFDWVVGSALMRMTPQARKACSQQIRSPSKVFFIATLALVLFSGGLRLYYSQLVQQITDLFSGYGLYALLAVLILFIFFFSTHVLYQRMRAAIDNEADAQFKDYVKTSRIYSTLTLLLIVYLMSAMRLGLY